MKGDYDLFFEYYCAVYDYVLAGKVSVNEQTLHDFLHTQQYYRLSHEAQRFAKRFADEDIAVDSITNKTFLRAIPLIMRIWNSWKGNMS